MQDRPRYGRTEQERRSRKPSIWFEIARRAALALPGVAEDTTAAGPVFRIGRRRLAWLSTDGVSLVVFIGEDEREMLIAAEPRTFSAVGHDRGRPLMRVHLAYVDEVSLARILTQGYRELARRRARPRSQSRP
ncbi:MmcQ/YjbR family DNA-binding protein [Methylobacterium oryzisoli]|uniref:MmcQ/YjbR family DNA-binding protein n=1 Tax=Methylobacterium oryzisoli TaxID=3385502 RepID=UPI003891A028